MGHGFIFNTRGFGCNSWISLESIITSSKVEGEGWSETGTLYNDNNFAMHGQEKSLWNSKRNSPLYFASGLFNNLPINLRIIGTVNTFTKEIKKSPLSFSYACWWGVSKTQTLKTQTPDLRPRRVRPRKVRPRKHRPRKVRPDVPYSERYTIMYRVFPFHKSWIQ